jgi:hypothetical protein
MAWPVGARADVSTTVTVPAATQWIDTGLRVTAGSPLAIEARGRWTEGSIANGPGGARTASADNFLNLSDLGSCNACAGTATARFGALIGYIGESPPAPGSYTSAEVRPEAARVFLVGSRFAGNAGDGGELWLAHNDGAYSGYAADDSGEVAAQVSAQGGESDRPPALPSGDVLYRADWSRGLTGWVGSRQWQVSAERLESDGSGDTGSGGALTAAPVLPASDYAVVVSARILSSQDNGCDFAIFGRAARAPAVDAYVFGIIPTVHGTAAVADGSLDNFGEGELGRRGVSDPRTGWHVYEAEFRGSALTFRIDGTAIVRASDTHFAGGGHVGLMSGDGCQVEIGSFEVLAR